MGFKPTAETPIRKLPDGIEIVSGPGGSPWVTDPARPHLGGNFDGGDLGTMYQGDLWPWLMETFLVRTMMDIGCGTGETLKWFTDHGVDGVGVEGLPWNVQRCIERGAKQVFLHDFENGAWLGSGFVDLIWCADVVEHIDEKYVDGVLQTLQQGKVLAMCQGTEGNANDGWNHVNNQPEQYWVDKLASVGMIEDVAMTEKSRELGNHGWWSFTGRIYRRAD